MTADSANRPAGPEPRTSRIRAVAAIAGAVPMIAVSAGLTLVFHLSDPAAGGFTTAATLSFVVSAVSTVIFIGAAVVLGVGRAGSTVGRILEIVYWLDLLLLVAASIILSAAGLLWSFLLLVAAVLGFDPARQFRRQRRG